MHQRERTPLPLDRQTGLPSSITFQPTHVGGSLGFGAKTDLEAFWDKLEAEVAADTAAAGAAGGADLRQALNDFLFQATVVSQLVVPYNRDRTYLFLQNLGAANVFVSFGHAAIVNGSMRLAAAGGFYEPILGTVESVHMIAAAGSNNVVIIEGFRAP